MKRINDMNKNFKLALLGSALALAAGPASAEVYDLCAGATTIDLPDGSSVPMWGYAPGGATGGVCDSAPTFPGPRLTVTDGALTINLTNTLPESTSIVIPGLPMPAGGPTWDDGTTGARTSATQRVRSFGAEVASEATGSYSFTVGRSGTFLYHSGTHPQKQVYMGLGGPVTQDALAAVPPALAEAYPGVPYEQDLVLFYSEIDPDLNAAIVGGSYQTSIDYHAKWFLVNGEPYSTVCTDGNSDLVDDASGYPCASMAQTAEIDAGVAKTPTLLRFLSTAGETHVPTLQGLHMTIHAEDGIPYGWEDTSAGTFGTAPRQQYSVMLPPLKTKDAIIEPQLDGTYALYDGNGYMTNPTDPEDFFHKDPVGGMLRFLLVAQDGAVNEPPVAGPDFATVVESGTITIDVLANDSDPEGQPLTIAGINTTGTTGTVVCNGTCEYTAAAGAGTDTFTYDVSDGVETTAGVLVTVTVEANVAPIANPDSATTDAATPVTVNVLANDVGQPGETLAIGIFDITSDNGSAVSCDTVTGDCTYAPNTADTTDTFTYTATDGTFSAAATVTITVNPEAGNAIPVATDDTYNVIEDGILSIAAPGVLENDTDDDNVPPANPWDGLTVTLVTGPTNADANGFNLLDTGAFFYRPTPGFSGTDTFTYVANDGLDDSGVATVTITVNPGNDIPVANNDTFYLKSMYAPGQVTTVTAPGVLENDTDADVGDTLTAVLDTGVEPLPELVLNSDGSFTYTTNEMENLTLDTVDTFTYFAYDGNVNSTFPATVNLVRKLTVIQAVCERRNNGRCDWRIEGDKLEAGGRVEAWFGGTRIGRTAPTGAGPWTISVNNSQVNTGLGPIDFRVDTDGNAEILAYPPTEQ